MNAVITRDDPLWNTTYPKGILAIAGESLAGFVLRLDEANHLDAGAALRAIKSHPAGPANTTGPGYFLSAGTLYLTKLAQLAGVSITDLESLTVIPLLRWLYGGRRGSTTIGSATAMRVCPLCLAGRVIPLVTLLRGVEACPEHHTKLLDICACGDSIRLFPGVGCQPFVCAQPGCRTDFAQLTLQPVDAADLARSNALAGSYTDLLLTAPGRAHLPRHEISARLRAALLAAGISRDDDPRLFARVTHPSSSTIADVLVRTMTRAEETLGSPSDPTHWSRRRRGSKESRPQMSTLDLGSSCPNIACPGGGVYLNGHAAALDNQQERLCKGCGTRWTASRVLFSFDRVAGYSIAKAMANAGRLVGVSTQGRRCVLRRIPASTKDRADTHPRCGGRTRLARVPVDARGLARPR